MKIVFKIEFYKRASGDKKAVIYSWDLRLVDNYHGMTSKTVVKKYMATKL